jgi:membrane protease subunit (stomatin/prohibitin family)
MLLVVAVLGTLACVGLAGLLVVGFIWMRISAGRRKANEMDLPTMGGAPSGAYGGPQEAAFSSMAQGASSAQAQSEANVVCPNCGRANRGGAKFCNNCGFKL